MTTVTIHAAKTHLSKLIEQAERGEEIIIARVKKPVARLIAFQSERRKRGFGSMKGKVWLDESFGSLCPRRS